MEARLFPEGTVPEFTTPEWYAGRERAPHLEQPGHRQRLLLAAEFVSQMLDLTDSCSVSDMGCGDGGLLSVIQRAGVCACWGYDLQPSSVDGGHERGVDVRLGDAVTGDVEWGEITVCTEMLEHLLDPHAFVASIPSRAVVASSPAGETAQNHYEFHTWAWDMDGYRAMFEGSGWRVARHESLTGFQVLLAVRP